MRRFNFLHRRALKVIFVALLALACPLAAFSSSTLNEKLEHAQKFFDESVDQLQQLQLNPAADRTEKDYLTIIKSFWRVYQTAPSSSLNPQALMYIGELYRSMGHNFEKSKYSESAVKAYDFLLDQYPHSRYRAAAMLNSAQVYESDLKNPDEARKLFTQVLKAHPRAPQANDARSSLTILDAQARSKKGTQGDTAGNNGAASEKPPVAASAQPQTARSSEVARDVKVSETEKTESRPESPSPAARQKEQASNADPKPDAKPEPPAVSSAASGAPAEIAPVSASKRSKPLVKVTDVRRWVTADSTRVVIDLAGEVKYETGTLENPRRVYVDLIGTSITRAVTRQANASDGGIISRLRAAQNQLDVTRVVAEVPPNADYSVFNLPNPNRLIIEFRHPKTEEAKNGAVRETGAAQPDAATSHGSTAVSAISIDDAGHRSDKPAAGAARSSSASPGARPVLPASALASASPAPGKETAGTGTKNTASGDVPADPPYSSASADTGKRVVNEKDADLDDNRARSAKANPLADPDRSQPALPNRNGSRSLSRILGLKIDRIILDPGHGGHDTGTVGPSGFAEKDLVLDVSLRLGKLIEQRLGSEVIYTRQDDTFIPLETRTAIANEKGADLFISIHANSSPSPSARGIETYYLSFAADPQAMEVAARENSVSQESLHDLPDLVKKIALNDKLDESRDLAAEVQTALYSSLNKSGVQRKNRGVKKAPFMVLVGAKMPSILAEIAFLSNPQEEKLLRTKQQRQKIAEALYAGIEKYVDALSGIKVANSLEASAAATR